MHRLSSHTAIERPLEYHRKTYAAIRNGNAKEARRQMLEHITDAQALLGSAKWPCSCGDLNCPSSGGDSASRQAGDQVIMGLS
jgi:hypothetical protein